ncbi:MAG: nicotinate (nicotinamide) nucleotide adenylyltransferase [Lentisphaerae bacterium]|nr:nicotinate (nicotinamide) nucleotide adenylyltransferase [Lentisphaerota bacterium]
MEAGRQLRIGIVGGTFNPVHIGHLILAQTALESFDLAKVLLVPCARPPHKNTAALIPAEHRVAMLAAALEDSLTLELCDVEVRRGGTSYSVDTLRQLRRAYPNAELCFVIGADTLPELHGWRDVYRLLELCRVVTFRRPGVTPRNLTPEALRLRPPWPERLLRDLVPGRMIDVSSSDIRHRVAEGMSIRYMVPRAVEMYIAVHGLYTGGG